MNWTIEALRNYRKTEACYGEQEDYCRRFEVIAENPDYFLRTTPTAHFTASAVLLSPDKRKALFTLHRKLNRWLQLGGHADGETNLSLTALREAQEESGILQIELLSHEAIDLDIHWIPQGKEPGHFHYDMRFLLWSPTADLPKCSEESHALEWFSLEHPFEEPSLTRLLMKAKGLLSR